MTHPTPRLRRVRGVLSFLANSEQGTRPVPAPRSIRTSCNVAEANRGIDAARKVKGRERDLATDTGGLLLAVIVTAASVKDSAGRTRIFEIDSCATAASRVTTGHCYNHPAR